MAIAVAFQPVRERVRHLANRIVYGKRATPYEVLSEFSDQVATSFAAEDVLPRMAQILAERHRRELGSRVASVRRGAPAGRVVAGERLGLARHCWKMGTRGGFGEGEDGVRRSVTSASSSARCR